MDEGRELTRLEPVQSPGGMSRVEEIQCEKPELLLGDNLEQLQKLHVEGCSGPLSCIFWKEDDTNLESQAHIPEVDEDDEEAPVDRKGQSDIMQSMVDEVWGKLEEQKVGILGLYGKEGAGKTTLLDHILNRYINNPNDFDVIMFIVISRNFELEQVQTEIGRQIGCLDDGWTHKNHHHKASDIFKILRRKKFVLLLDDVFARIDLRDVGVPVPDVTNRSKLVFTTRAKEICRKMRAHRNFLVKHPHPAKEITSDLPEHAL